MLAQHVAAFINLARHQAAHVVPQMAPVTLPPRTICDVAAAFGAELRPLSNELPPRVIQRAAEKVSLGGR
eukprot:2948141-Alexandrium_andersonii.AAC.1